MRNFSLTFILLLGLFTCGSDDDKDNNNNNTSQFNTFKSQNVKTLGDHYFSFATNSAVTTETAEYDVILAVRPMAQSIGNCDYMEMPSPTILCGPDISIAKVDAESLEQVTTIPANDQFKVDQDAVPVIGFNWFDSATLQLKADSYAFMTCQSDYAAIQVISFNYNPSNHHVFDLTWAYKYISSGQTDFTAVEPDTFVAPESYDEPTYFSFTEGKVAATDDWQIKLVGENIWLTYGVAAQTLTGQSLAQITSAPTVGYSTDIQKSYVTGDWYDFNQGTYIITPRPITYIVNTRDGKYPVFRVLSYYDDMGKSGSYTIEWKYLK
jgi:hypothetical protein